jgi:hypothetical protein
MSMNRAAKSERKRGAKQQAVGDLKDSARDSDYSARDTDYIE